ncbi:hypothetical protein PHLGIDRAFT_276179 [Phlebiopsis gigantea 11061_1 CR5-6]|uniref:Uncharacterized protein n=1 Tax=Phlebiopsis gigantea (strain 11061_1 CR5-6) TaxID=745531 RepID=A0A0C3S141_PHLG1|nr:hypothetical protein PHLGIDRAFT_276179 [Phlebiopsis gigantea 11061_1 CR5-6]
MSFAFFMLEAAVCDLIMVYRLWVIWSHAFAIIIVPAVTFVVALVFAFVYICNVARSLPSSNGLFSPPYLYWFLTSLACSVATNIYCTAFISYRVWRTQESVKHSRFTGSSTGRVSSGHLLGILVESAGIYTATMLSLLITYTVRSPVSFLITDLVSSGYARWKAFEQHVDSNTRLPQSQALPLL